MGTRNKIAVLLLMILVGSTTFYFGYRSGESGLVFEPTAFRVVNQKDTVAEVDYNLLWDAINIVSKKYIDSPVDQKEILYGAVKGAVHAAGDEYTQFFTPEEYASFKTDLKGSFSGIGAEIGKKDGQIVIVSPIDDSPAEKAGLLPQDYIVQVNGKPTLDWTTDQTVKEIRGEKGTEVTLTIYREGRTGTFDVKIIRDEIKIKSVKLEYKEVSGKRVAVLTLSRFGDDTEELFKKAVEDIVRNKPDGMVLDLRNDPGGYIDAAIDVASYWVKKDQLVVTQESTTKPKIEFKSFGYGSLENVKTIVLINVGSASASEIVSGALQDHKIAKLMGEKSFGKGSVQELIEMTQGSAVKVTVAKWITPGGKHLNKDGLVPDIEVKRSEDDIKNNRDPQLDQALQEITK